MERRVIGNVVVLVDGRPSPQAVADALRVIRTQMERRERDHEQHDGRKSA